ncbi:hypothetical protein FRC19_002750 [Serendipita sp. 401]|nr:hypothetical protein FRC19_002750 [Serendipita sp. 401]
MDVDNSLDYSQGEVRNHHRFYLARGDVVIQVEKALFKIHRHFLAQYSPALEGLFELFDNQVETRGEKDPVIMEGDSYRGWEALLGLFYRANHMEAPSTPWDDAMALLPIAHKYCMEPIENSTLGRIQQERKSKDQLIDVICISKKLDMFDLFITTTSELSKAPEPIYYEDTPKLGPFISHMIANSYSLDCVGCGKSSHAVCLYCKQEKRWIRRALKLPLRESDWRI